VFTHIHSECAIKKIENLKVYDPNKSLKKKIIEMAIRVAPEGFRVRYHSFKGEEFIFVATEEIMNDEWIKEARKMLYDLKEAE
ncbi:MAG: methanogenesis marker 17 protein, partial [Methanosarcinaceae archaeon]|nr:methanogenesis marker 17 protein [Methanosarcinaceae archaeon]